MEQPIQPSQLENTKKKILFKIRRKDTTFTKDNMNDENFYLNISHNRNFSPNVVSFLLILNNLLFF